MQAYVTIIGTSAAVYAFVIVALRLFGKKEIAQLSVIDLVFVLLISNAVQNAMVGNNTTLAGGLVAASTLFVLNFLLKSITYQFPKLSDVVQGESVMLIYNGQINLPNLRKTKLSIEELNEALREHGVKDAREVDLAVLELDGNISVLSNDYQTRTTQTKHKRSKQVKTQKKEHGVPNSKNQS